MNESELSIFNRVWQVCQEHNQNDLVTIRNWVNVEIIAYRSRFPTNRSFINENFIFNNIITRINVSIDSTSQALYNPQQNIPWIRNYIAEHNNPEDFIYWKRYKNLLRIKNGLNPIIINELDDATNKILDGMANPNQINGFNKKGMVIGYVQSGKTSNYIGLINKSLDIGYKFVIVLTGMHNNLRQQTQIRIDEGVIGVTKLDGINARRVGVGIGEGLINNFQTLTTSDYLGDFNKQRLIGLGVNYDTNMPFIAVIKKNVTPLRNLNNWLENELQLRNLNQSDKPILIIDDECDQASIDTSFSFEDYLRNRNIEDEENTTDNTTSNINSAIVSLMAKFSKYAYVGYTATPYANVFVPIDNPNYINIFPEDFIITLEQPSNYLGPEKYFEIDEIETDPLLGMYNTTDDNEFYTSLSELNENDISIEIPKSLITSTYLFIISSAIRYFRGENNVHMSMLVHITHLNKRQKILKDSFTVVWNEIKESILANDISLIDKLRKVYNGSWGIEAGIESNIDPQFEITNLYQNIFPNENFSLPESFEVLIEHIRQFIGSVEILLINTLTQDKLDYHLYSTGRKVIVFGGNTMSRGLTLEGLSTSYFLRAAGAYDTLMQMGRWFGYRKNYSDLCRIITTDQISEYFSEICKAEILMRKDILTMIRANVPPRDFMIRIRNSALSIAVTSKMGAARILQISWAGGEVITSLIAKDVSLIKSNHIKLNNFLTSLLNTANLLIEAFRNNSLIIKNVPVNMIIQLKSLDIVDNNASLDFELIHEYYIKCGFKFADIVLIGRSISNESFSMSQNYQNKIIGLSERNSAKPEDSDMFRVRNSKLTDADYISNFINEQDKQNLTTTELRTPSILCQYISKPIISFLPINPYYFYSKKVIDRNNRPILNDVDSRISELTKDKSIPFGISIITPLKGPGSSINGVVNSPLSSLHVLINESVQNKNK